MIQAKLAHPQGMIEVKLKRDEKGSISGSIRLPDELTGVFKFNNRKIALKGGVSQAIDVD